MIKQQTMMRPIIYLLILVGTSPLLADDSHQSPGLGQAITAEELASISINVMPDGRGLPEGEGSVVEGELLYSQRCMACHGEAGVGNSAEQLAGAVNELSSEWPEKTIGSYWPYVTTLFDFTRRSMPMTQPGSS